MVKNSVVLLSNEVDTSIDPPGDDVTSLGTIKRKWKSVHASEFDAHQGPVKNVKLVANTTTFVGDVVPHTYIDQLQSTVPIIPIANVIGLQSTLDGKAVAVHTHSIANVLGLQSTLNNLAAKNHTHTFANVTGLQLTGT